MKNFFRDQWFYNQMLCILVAYWFGEDCSSIKQISICTYVGNRISQVKGDLIILGLIMILDRKMTSVCLVFWILFSLKSWGEQEERAKEKKYSGQIGYLEQNQSMGK